MKLCNRTSTVRWTTSTSFPTRGWSSTTRHRAALQFSQTIRSALSVTAVMPTSYLPVDLFRTDISSSIVTRKQRVCTPLSTSTRGKVLESIFLTPMVKSLTRYSLKRNNLLPTFRMAARQQARTPGATNTNLLQPPRIAERSAQKYWANPSSTNMDAY